MQTVSTTTNIPHSLASTVTMLDPKEMRRRESEARRVDEWLEARIEKARRTGAFSEIVTITPVLAERLLRQNENNRAIRRNRLEEIKRDLLNKKWAFNGESIIVAVTGKLVDGQHRLAACAATGQPIETIIVFGVHERAGLTVDTGTVRTVANFLEMRGQPKDAGIAAAVARYIFIYDNHETVVSRSIKHQDRPTKRDLQDVEETNRDPIQISIDRTSNTKLVKLIGPRSLIAFCHLILRRRDEAAANRFMDGLITGANLPEDSTLWVLRQRLLNDPKMPPQQRFEAILRAWNAVRRGEALSRIALNGKPVKVAA